MEYLWAVLLVIGSFVGWVTNVLGLPGNWFTLAIVSVYAYFGPAAGRLSLGWGVVGGLAALAVAGEIIEFVAGAWGAKQAGGSKRGAALALVGSMLGGMLGLMIGTPIPVIGSLVAAILGAALGALGGAILGERWKGRDMDESWRVGSGAFWGRLFGTLGKTLAGTIMVVVVIVALIA